MVLISMLAADPRGAIAYVSGRMDAERSVMVIDVGTRAIVRAGPGRGDGAPRWSPDGTRIAFDTRTEEGRAIYLVRPDGSDGTYLPHAAAMNRDPEWSQDSTLIAYSVGSGSDQRIAVYSLLTGEEQVWGGGRMGLMTPAWLAPTMVASLLSDEVGRIRPLNPLFTDRGQDTRGVVAVGLGYASDVLSSDLFLVTETETIPLPRRIYPTKGTYVEWRPRPAWGAYALAYESDDGGDREIFVFSRKGVLDLSNHRAADWNPVWAPDNSWIAFESFRSGRRGVYRVHPDTAGVYPVAVSPHAANWSPSWSSDSKWIAFVSNRTGSPELFMTESKGDETVQLTADGRWNGAPSWRPQR